MMYIFTCTRHFLIACGLLVVLRNKQCYQGKDIHGNTCAQHTSYVRSRKERKATQTNKTYNTQTRQTGHTVHRPDKQDTQYTDQTKQDTQYTDQTNKT